LIENSGVKFDFNVSYAVLQSSRLILISLEATPRPNGRTVVACQRMMDRLKSTLKTELEAFHAGNPIVEGTPKKTPTPRKRKSKDAEASGDAEASPTKRGRKKKGAEPVPEPVKDDDKKLNVKGEVEDEV
jgi:hypothetical protein